MKKCALVMAFLLSVSTVFAQNKGAKKDSLEGWHHSGNFALIFNQTAFNADWQDGGTSNIAGNLTLDYEMDYKKDRLSWDNNLIAEYGLTKIKGNDFLRKTNDRLELNSVLGYQIKEGSKWYYSFFANFKTQFDRGYDYQEDVEIKDANGNLVNVTNIRTENSRFMSPGYLKFGPGILYKNGDLLKVNFAPLSSRFIFVDDMFTTVPGYVDGAYYGVDQGKSMRFEFGASLGVLSKITLVKNVVMKNNVSLYSDYLEDPQNIDIDYTLNLIMKINKFMSANFVFQAIYDDNTVRAFQVRETLGVGFSYRLK